MIKTILNKIEDYDNIIFDFGGIFIDIDYSRTIEAFSTLGENIDVNVFYNKNKQIDVFNDLEVGKIDAENFRSQIREIVSSDKSRLNDEQIDLAWNAMLGDIPYERVKYLEDLSKRKNVYLFSNINEIHEKYIMSYFSREENKKVSNFLNLFNKTYFSHKIGHRKPNLSAFEYIINDIGCDKNKVLFIDDSSQHVEGARLYGIEAVLLERPNTFIVGE